MPVTIVSVITGVAIFVVQTIIGNLVYDEFKNNEVLLAPQPTKEIDVDSLKGLGSLRLASGEGSEEAVTLDGSSSRGSTIKAAAFDNKEGLDEAFVSRLDPASIGALFQEYFLLDKVTASSWKTQLDAARKNWHKYSYWGNDAWVSYFAYFNENNWNVQNLHQACTETIVQTPRRAWWGGGRRTYWNVLWDFCVKSDKQSEEKPENWWYR